MTTTHDKLEVRLAVKAVGTDEGLQPRQFSGYASVFGNVDSYGDVVMPGAFAKSLQEWAASGAEIPLLWAHDMHSLAADLGRVVEAKEDDHGLLVTCEFDEEADVPGTPAAKAYRLLKGRRLNTMSFAYDVQQSSKGEVDGATVNMLEQLKLYEVSLVRVPANPEAVITAVKSAPATAVTPGPDAKAGRSISAANLAKLQKAADAVGAALEELQTLLASDSEDTPPADEPAKGTAPETTAAPAAAQDAPAREARADADEPQQGKSADAPASQLRDLELALALAGATPTTTRKV